MSRTPRRRLHSRVISADHVTEQSATKLMTALTACEYSHCSLIEEHERVRAARHQGERGQHTVAN